MSFSEIVGHARSLGILRRILQSGCVAHAYLFEGPDGVGKATVARIFAGALHCLAGGDGPCGTCGPCRKVDRGVHPDMVWMEAQGAQILIGQIRGLQKQMAYRPLEGTWRTVVIDGAHDLNPQASNALLKILEEPPDGNVLILVARAAGALLPTIVSRCQVVHFSPLSPRQIARFLQGRRGWPEEQAREVSLRALGSIGRALEMAQDSVGDWEAAWLRVMGAMDEMSTARLLSCAKEWSGGREDAMGRLGALLGLIRDLVLLAVGHEGIDRAGHGEVLRPLAQGWGLDALLRGWEKASLALRGMEGNWNPQLVMEELLLEMRRMRVGERS
jgi:DNA polymerase-3 subunit delta'